jgi:hypothetical protein
VTLAPSGFTDPVSVAADCEIDEADPVATAGEDWTSASAWNPQQVVPRAETPVNTPNPPMPLTWTGTLLVSAAEPFPS